MTDIRITLTPMLSVPDAKEAIGFYKDAFGAEELYLQSAPDGALYGAVSIGDAQVEITSEAPGHDKPDPGASGDPAIRLSLMVPDPDAVAIRAVAAGASIIFPIADQPYGYRQGRIEDPFGHQWLLGRPLADRQLPRSNLPSGHRVVISGGLGAPSTHPNWSITLPRATCWECMVIASASQRKTRIIGSAIQAISPRQWGIARTRRYALLISDP